MPKHRFKIAKSMTICAVLLLAVLLVCSASIAQAADNDPALVTAARQGDLKEVIRLFNRGADIGAKNRGGKTALMAAARGGNLDVVKFPIDKGADVNAKENSSDIRAALLMNLERFLTGEKPVAVAPGRGRTALEIAREHGHKEIVQYLKAHGAQE